ncbi:impB/mucB/samB family protein [Pelagibacterium luteolum]|uniref:DNA-directed DNA polymerase n=1 Tax=Pelagibacterium luteolum TaxID=440168 RepID=A0A1G8AM67_9HYPH|nr:impB/mucB/samB family protein [Pelagibacterium luteolum]
MQPGDKPTTDNGDRDIRKIIHVDMDAFFASVEQRDDPQLRGKPVAVGGAKKRGVVAAASYEARQFGVRSAMPSATAARKCPELIFVKPRFEVYKAVSAQIHEIFGEYTALVEPLSLDESYLDVTDNFKGMAIASEIAEAIRARIFEVTGLTASAGISYNKFLAKMASGHKKPNGQFVITPAKGPAFVETLPIEKFHGIGPATAARMKAPSLTTSMNTGRHLLKDTSVGADQPDRNLGGAKSHATHPKIDIYGHQIVAALFNARQSVNTRPCLQGGR